MKNVNESGRSMVEMLGVLAIIGVLSIGGIAGYTMAMNKYKANNIVHAVVQASIECRTRGSVSATAEADIFPTGIGAALAGATKCNGPDGTVGFKVSSTADIAKLVCKTLKPYTAIDGTTETTCASATTSTTMYYRPAS